MRLHNFAYLIKQGTKNIFRNKLMSFACIGVLVACMLLIGAAVLFTITVNNIAQVIEDQNEIVVFLDTDLSVSDVEAVDVAMRATDNIIKAKFISKEQGLEEERSKMGDYGDLLAGLEGSENPLPDKYILHIDDSSKIKETVQALSAIDGVEKVSASMEISEILIGVKQTVYYSGASVVIILIVVSLVIITNTIKLTIFSRRKEINIMKYVGATDSFIRLPFLVEGMFIGLVAALVAFLMLGFGYTYLINWASQKYIYYFDIIFNNAVQFEDIAGNILMAFSAVGVLIGMFSSGVFVRKHLKV